MMRKLAVRPGGFGMRGAFCVFGVLGMMAGSVSLSDVAHAEEIASVSTNFRMTGSDKVVIEAYDDPLVEGITCYVSRARTGGIKGSLGMAEDPPEASIACRQVDLVPFYLL